MVDYSMPTMTEVALMTATASLPAARPLERLERAAQFQGSGNEAVDAGTKKAGIPCTVKYIILRLQELFCLQAERRKEQADIKSNCSANGIILFWTDL